MILNGKKRRTLLIVLGLIGLAALGGYWGLRTAAVAIFSDNKATPTAEEFSDWVKLEIPPTAQNWKAYGEGFQDWLIQARFELTPQELAVFLQRNKLHSVLFTQPPQNVFKQSWFSPKTPLEVYELESSQTQQSSTASGFYPSVYVEHDGSKLIIYIVAFDT